MDWIRRFAVWSVARCTQAAGNAPTTLWKPETWEIGGIAVVDVADHLRLIAGRESIAR